MILLLKRVGQRILNLVRDLIAYLNILSVVLHLAISLLRVLPILLLIIESEIALSLFLEIINLFGHPVDQIVEVAPILIFL